MGVRSKNAPKQRPPVCSSVILKSLEDLCVFNPQIIAIRGSNVLENMLKVGNFFADFKNDGANASGERGRHDKIIEIQRKRLVSSYPQFSCISNTQL